MPRGTRACRRSRWPAATARAARPRGAARRRRPGARRRSTPPRPGSWGLTWGEVRYLPAAFCYYDYPQPDEQTYCLACSNGCAAGNTLAEAILQGFLELVERDAVALWW